MNFHHISTSPSNIDWVLGQIRYKHIEFSMRNLFSKESLQNDHMGMEASDSGTVVGVRKEVRITRIRKAW